MKATDTTTSESSEISNAPTQDENCKDCSDSTTDKNSGDSNATTLESNHATSDLIPNTANDAVDDNTRGSDNGSSPGQGVTGSDAATSAKASEASGVEKATQAQEKLGLSLGWWKIGIGAIGAVVGGGALVVAAPLALAAVGFGSGGVVAGSVAAGIQAGIGNVAAGSLFAACQSAGVVGLGAATNVAIGATGAAVGAATVGGAAAAMSGDKKEGDDPKSNSEKDGGVGDNPNNNNNGAAYCEKCKEKMVAARAEQDKACETVPAPTVPEQKQREDIISNNSTNIETSNKEKEEKGSADHKVKESDKKDEKELLNYCVHCQKVSSRPAI